MRLCRSGVGGRGRRGGIREEKRVLLSFVRPFRSVAMPQFGRCFGSLFSARASYLGLNYGITFIFLRSSRERVNRPRVELRSSIFLPQGRKTAYFMCFRGSPS